MKLKILLIVLLGHIIGLQAQQLGNGWTLGITDFSALLNSGAYESCNPIGGVPDNAHPFQHLFALRHSNTGNNHQFQLGTSYAENDRLFFRKIANGLEPKSTTWNELATRGANTFNGNQTITGNLLLNNGLSFNYQQINFAASPRTTINPMSIKLWDNYNNGGPSTYGSVLEIYGLGGHQTSQLYFGGWDNSKIRYRESFYGQNTWNDWITMLDSKNDVESQGSLKISGGGNHFIANGNVGIGTTDTKQRLTVDSKQTKQNAGVPSKTGTTQNGVLRLQVDGESWGEVLDFGMNVLPTYAWIQATNRGNLGLNYNLSLNPNGGNVGIGTTKPTHLLSVNGTIRAKEVLVDLCENLADYVFSPDYSLMPLPKVEAFVKQNKHLPEIPSAAEVKEKGLSMGEMQNKLLQKIEELTLYVIEQQKQIEELKTSLNHKNN